MSGLITSLTLGDAGVAEICSKECRLCLVPVKGHLEMEEGVVNK